MELKIIKLCLLVVLICAVLSAGGGEKEDENDDDPFVPTHDWQIVQKGKKIPKGLHIRINLETGVTEAKLLEEKEEKRNNGKTALTIAVQENAGDSSAESKLSQLKEALKNIEDDFNVQNEEVLKRVDKFKSYEELKKDLSELNLTPKADTEILKELVEKHVELTATQKSYDEDLYAILLVLEDLEYLIHQYDNANEFVSLNGFPKIIYKNLNSTSKEIKSETLKLLGSCLQNNVKVKIHALETGTLDVLLRLLALEDDPSLKNRGFFALGALLRGFPYAQLKFVRNAGVSVLSKLFESKDLKLHLRLVTLISDLLQEETSVRSDAQHQDKSALQQYDEIQLRKLLTERDYCENLIDLLIQYVTIDPGDHDVVEKILNAFAHVVDDCALRPVPNKITELLVNLKSMYEKLADNQSDAGDAQYFITLRNVTGRLVERLTRNVKTEL